MGDIVTVNFRGDDLYGFKQDDGVFLAVKPMCEAMGIAYDAQRQRINRDPILSKAASIMLAPFAGKGQEVTCLQLKRVNFFLATIDTNRIKDDSVREKVRLYQEECADVLYEHFSGKRRPMLANDEDAEPDTSTSINERRSLVAEARQTFGTQAARELWFNQNLPITPAMLNHGQNDMDLFHYGAVKRDEAA